MHTDVCASNQKQSPYQHAGRLLLCTVVVLSVAGEALAGTDTTFGTAKTQIIAMAGGSGGALCAGISLFKNMGNAAWKFGLNNLGEPIGVGLMGALGGAIIGGMVTAMI